MRLETWFSISKDAMFFRVVGPKHSCTRYYVVEEGTVAMVPTVEKLFEDYERWWGTIDPVWKQEVLDGLKAEQGQRSTTQGEQPRVCVSGEEETTGS